MKRILSTLLVLLVPAGAATAGGGDVLWTFEFPQAPGMHRPSIGPDGTLYLSAERLHALSPAGQELWSRPQADANPVGIGVDGTLYVGGYQPPPNDHLPALKAFAPNGDHLWDFTALGQVVGFIGGPQVGPDGNVYATTFDGFDPAASGIGLFSLTPGGALRWHVDGFANQMAGAAPSELLFGDGHVYKAEAHAPMPAGQLQSGLIAVELDGDVAWQASYGVPSSSPHRHPALSPLNGNVHATRPSRTLQTFDPAGNLLWHYTGPYTPTGFGAPAVGPDGSVYVINGDLHVIALDADGGVRWTAQNVVPKPATAPEVSPDGSLLVFGTHACFGAACPGRVIGIDTADGSVVFDEALPPVPGGVPTAETRPRFSQDGSVVYLGASAFASNTEGYLFAIDTGDAGWQRYCTPKTTSLGCAPAISATGTPGPASGGPFVVQADPIPSQQPGIFIYSLQGAAATPFQGGTLCIGLPLVRTPAQGSGGNAPPLGDCSGSYAFDFDAWVAAGADPGLVPGAAVHGQYWFRDGGDPFGSGLSDGIAFTLQP